MNMKVKKQMISLLVLAMFSGMCWAQGPTSAMQAEAANKGQMFQLKDVKMARSGEQWFKVTTDINCHSQYAPLHKMMTRVLFGKEKECSSLDSALQRHMAEYDEVNENALLRVLNAENRKFYEGREDKGKAFINSLLDGEYGGYKYSKQLIGLYKHCEEAILAVILRDEGDEEGYQECVSNLEHFAKETRLGKRWTKELGIEIKDEEETPAEEEGEEGQEEVKAIEMKDPEIKTELTEAEDTEVKEDA